VLRVFGVRNMLRTLREVPRPRWDACVRAAVYESRLRLADPVRGCSGAIEDLEAQLMDTAVELEVLRRRLESYRLARSRGLRFLLPPNPRRAGGADAAASAWGVTDLGAARQQSTGSWASDDVMQPQGPHGGAWPTGTAGLAATPPQFYYAMQQLQGPHGGTWPTGTAELAATPTQFYGMPQPQVPHGGTWRTGTAGLDATPTQFYAMPQPQVSHGGAWRTGTAELATTPPQFYAMPQPQGPHGGAWPTGTAELAATPPQFYPMQAQYPPMIMPPQLPATQPPQFPAMQPQPAMRRQTTSAKRGATAMILDDDSWADDDQRRAG
jgi:hypothetical protein